MRFIITTAILIVLALPAWSEESYKDFKNSIPSDFKEYQAGIEKEFEAYQKISNEEFNKFSGKVKQAWGDNIVTSGKVWVEYSPDMKTRRIVNFETGEITIQIQNESVNLDKKAFENDIKIIATESAEQAFQKDEVVTNIEKRFKSEGITAESATIPTTPMLNDIIPNITALLDKGRVTYDTLANGVKVGTLKASVEMDYPAKNSPTLNANTALGKIHKKATSFKDTVEQYAKQYKIPAALIFAITHNESSFNPLAKSYVPAYGMMQLVPTSGGKEASSVVFGKQTILAPSYFYNPKNNIMLGTIYLSQLYYIYFKDVRDLEARLYCTICAYNTGPGNVAKAFTGNRNLKIAVPLINSMSGTEVYNKLATSLPYEETKTYLKRVTSSFNAYSTF